MVTLNKQMILVTIFFLLLATNQLVKSHVSKTNKHETLY